MSANEEQNFSIEIEGGVTVCVPADINLMTPYILLEQEDWFEDEIKFVRAFLKPGMRVIDIGVNYGTYFLTAAKCIGQSGKIWGFEPSIQCCSFVESSIEENGFRNTQLIQVGLSSHVGKAYLSLSENTELNTVSEILGAGQSGESIDLLTLDHCLEKMDIKDIDFIKMDAEGEESNIILGGKNFFETNSPLVMFELKHAERVNYKLISEFSDIGYRTYRLVPGLNCLIPFAVSEPVDSFQLNLFACKEDLAEKLYASGWLTDLQRRPHKAIASSGEWKNYLAQLNYAQELAEVLGSDFDRSSEKEFVEYYRALDLFAWSMNSYHDIGSRYSTLTESFGILTENVKNQGNLSFVLSLIRVAATLGRREVANELLSFAMNAIEAGRNMSLPVPFLSPCASYEEISIEGKLEHWLYSSIYMSHQLLSYYSSYYVATENINLLKEIENLGFSSRDLKRRKLLTLVRSGVKNKEELSVPIEQLTTKKTNARVWSQLMS